MEKTQAVIRKVGTQYCVFSHDGKNLGCSPSHEGAKQRLQQVEYFKHKESANMDYKHAFSKLVTDPADSRSPAGMSLSDKLRRGTIANRASAYLLDTKDHFPVITQTQAQSSMVRVLQLATTPDWYNGTLAQLRKEVYDGIIAMHPDIELNIRVPIEQTVALSDGQTPAETSVQSIKDPEDDRKKDCVPQVARPTLTSAEVAKALSDENIRKTVAGKLMDLLDEQLGRIQTARQVGQRLLNGGITSDEFDRLSTYVQQDILSELMNLGVKASSTSNEDRRRELLNKLGGNNGE